uniref:Uncharacterized protein n=1 Tax=Leishmania guyanensis TaxID=5670 RepID=A0A1E1IXQ9_LEIGU|nr:Putative uncharacterized protein [Leishmania guyanensis]
MERQPYAPFNGGEMQRQERECHLRQWQHRCVARFVIRLSIWLLGARLLSGCHPHALGAYLVLSMALMAWVLLGASDEQDDHLEKEAFPPTSNYDARTHGEDGSVALRRAGRHVRQSPALTRASVCAAAAKEGVTSPSKPLFTGILTPSQQRALVLELKELRTNGATRCAMDVAFRRRLVETELGETAICMCGSGEAFGSCCAPVKDFLLHVLNLA